MTCIKLKQILAIFITSLLITGQFSPATAEEATPEEPPATEPATPPTEIYITGALSPIGLERMGKPITIMTHKQLNERSEPTIGEMLSTQAGVSSTYFGPGSSRPVIRGQSKERVRVIENGLETGDASRVSEDHAVSVDPLSIQRIDVLRGPSTLLYGSGAIGGLVNMIDESIAEEEVGRAFTGELDLRKADEADEEGSGAATLKGQAGKINWYFSSFYRETDDIEIPGYAESSQLREMEEHEHEDGHDDEHHEEDEEVKGILPNSDTLAKGFKIGTSHVWDRGFVGLAMRMNNSKYGVPGSHHHGEEEHTEEDGEEHAEEHGEDEGVDIDLEQLRLESRGRIDLDESFFQDLRFGMTYSTYQHKELEGSEVGTRFDNDAFEGRIEVTHRHEDGFEGGMGTQIRYEDFKARGEEAFVPPSETFNPAFFAVEDYKINDLTVLQLGGRYEYANVSPEVLDSQDFHMISSSFGMTRNLDRDENYTAALNFSYSERAPTASELFADGAHVATQSFEIGDAGLGQERSVGSEIILKKNKGRLTASGSVFWQHYFDYINLAPDGTEDDGLPVYRYDMERARFWGFESEADLKLLKDSSHAASLYGVLDYVRGENLSDDDPLPRITPLRLRTGLRYQHEETSAFVESLFVSEQDRTADFELPTDNYTMLNVGASYQLPIEGRYTYEIYLRGTNLTDEEARVHTSFLKDQAPLRGRAFLAGLRLTF